MNTTQKESNIDAVNAQKNIENLESSQTSGIES